MNVYVYVSVVVASCSIVSTNFGLQMVQQRAASASAAVHVPQIAVQVPQQALVQQDEEHKEQEQLPAAASQAPQQLLVRQEELHVGQTTVRVNRLDSTRSLAIFYGIKPGAEHVVKQDDAGVKDRLTTHLAANPGFFIVVSTKMCKVRG